MIVSEGRTPPAHTTKEHNMNTIHPFPGLLAVARGVLVAAGAVGAALAFLPSDYTVCAATAVAFVGALVVGGE